VQQRLLPSVANPTAVATNRSGDHQCRRRRPTARPATGRRRKEQLTEKKKEDGS